jgi:hypothetical protein
VQARLLAFDNPGVACEEALALQDGAKLGVGLDERAGDTVTERSRLAARPSSLQACAEVELALDTGDAQRRGRRRPQRLRRDAG